MNENILSAIIGGLLVAIPAFVVPFVTKNIELEKYKYGLIKTKQYDILQNLYSNILDLYFAKNIDCMFYPDFSTFTEEELLEYLINNKCHKSWANAIVRDWKNSNKNNRQNNKAILDFLEQKKLSEARNLYIKTLNNFEKSEICIEESLSVSIKNLLNKLNEYIVSFEEELDIERRLKLYKEINSDLEKIKQDLRTELTKF